MSVWVDRNGNKVEIPGIVVTHRAATPKELRYLASDIADIARGNDPDTLSQQPRDDHDPETCDVCDKIAQLIAQQVMNAVLEERARHENELTKLRVLVEWQGDELSKRMACVRCGVEPHPRSELYSTVCPSCRMCFNCCEPMCPTCGDHEGTKQRAIDLRNENERLRKSSVKL